MESTSLVDSLIGGVLVALAGVAIILARRPLGRLSESLLAALGVQRGWGAQYITVWGIMSILVGVFIALSPWFGW